MNSALVGIVKLDNRRAIIDKQETRNDNEGRRHMPFDCSNEMEQYECETCPSFRTSFLTSLKHHQRNGHQNENSAENVYSCLKCFFVSNSKYLLVRHCHFNECSMKKENERKERFIQYRSNLRPKSEIQEYQIESELYLTKFKGKSLKKSHEFSPCAAKFTCHHCSSKFTRKATLLSHISIQHGRPEDIQWFNCGQCQYRCKRKGDLKKHFKLLHSTPKDIQWLKCDQCQYKSKQKGNLNIHIKLRHAKPEDIQWFKCDQCPHKYKRKDGLSTHIKLRHGKPEDIQWFKCDQCPYKCKRKGDLNKHFKLLHTTPEDIQWLKCDHCPYKCKQKGDLNRHFRLLHSTPEDIEWFKCDQCPHKYKRQGDLNKHLTLRHSTPEDI